MILRSLALSLALSYSLLARDTGMDGMGHQVPTDPETILRVQIFLDQNNFGPGKLDGSLGEFTYKAVVNFNAAQGYRDFYDWGPVLAAAAREVPVTLATHLVREDLFSYVNPKLSEKPEDWQSYKAMHYRSMLELIAERFHTDESFITRSNPRLQLDRLRPGQKVIVPNVRSFRIEEVKQYQGFKEDPILSQNIVVVDTQERMAAVYDPQNRMLGAFPITPGKEQFIPRGRWTITHMTTTPNFRYDKKFLEQGQRGDEAYEIPPGPNSPVGILWAGLSKSGIGLHGTAFPRTIGRSESAGCVRLANWDAIRLPSMVRPKARVIVK